MCLISSAINFKSFNKMLKSKSNQLSLCFLYVLLLTIHSNIASQLSKSSEGINQSMPYSQETNLQNVILDEENLEIALKKFIEAWDRTHGTHGTHLNHNNTVRRHHNKHQTNNQLNNKDNQQLDDKDSNSSLLNSWQSDSPSAPQMEYPAVIPPSWAKQRFNIPELISEYERSNRDDSENLHKVIEEFTNDELSQTENCTRCVMHEEAKTRRLETIKVNILNKLGLKVAPNITGKSLPRIPPLHYLLDRYNMLGDDPRLSGPSQQNSYLDDHDHTLDKEDEADYEEFFVNAERSISFAQPRKSLIHNQ
jgi:hypothetical protein